MSSTKPVLKSQVPQATVERSLSRTDLWICLGLFLAVFLVYAQVRHFDFVNFDDPDYVTANPHVRAGITADGLAWAFTSTEAANWFPLTRISHMLDSQVFGLRSGWHHLTNVLLHAGATLLLFLFLLRATRNRWASGFVAAVFALHPLHVESVAWIAERKDVLSAFFWFLTLWAYVRYTERPVWTRYAGVLAAFCLGLMAKPMVVTLPFVLVLLDVWPLGKRGRGLVPLVREKLPFFAISAAAAVGTYAVQHGSGAVEGLAGFPLSLRIENALASYLIYVAQMFWPAPLAAFYPYPAVVPVWQVALGAVMIAGVTVAVLRWRKDRPYLLVGWLWYLGTLVPVIGLVQVGAQAHADRYMYLPMVGLTIMLAWGGVDIVRRWPAAKPATVAVAVVVCLAMVPATWAQEEHWSNSLSLFQHALDVTTGNYVAHHNLGIALAETGRVREAVEEYQAALRIQPASARIHTDLGTALAGLGRLPDAVAEYRAALQLSPDSAIPHNNLGSALLKMGRMPEAIAEWETAVRLQPDYLEARTNLAHGLSATPGRSGEAIDEFKEVLRVAPNDVDAHTNLGVALAENGRLPEAIAEFQVALRLKPDSAEAHVGLGNALSKTEAGIPEAITHYEAALRVRPDDAEAQNNLGVVLSRTGRSQEAIPHFEAALRIRPDYADAHYNLGVALSEVPGRLPEAIVHFKAAQRIHPDPDLEKLLRRLR